MTAAAVGGVRKPLGKRIYGFLRAIPTWVLWIMVVLWTVPTIGLFVNSFRTRDAQRESGWWLFYQACSVPATASPSVTVAA